MPTDPLSDDELLSLVAEAEPPVPAWVLTMADTAWAWRDADGSLAELLDDSAVGATTSRSAAAVTRSVAYSLGGHVLELAVSPAGDREQVTVELLLAPARATAITVVVTRETTRTEIAVQTDATGSAALRVDATARISLRMDLDGVRHVTPWLTL